MVAHSSMENQSHKNFPSQFSQITLINEMMRRDGLAGEGGRLTFLLWIAQFIAKNFLDLKGSDTKMALTVTLRDERIRG